MGCMPVEASLLDWIGNRGRRCSVGEAAAGTGLSLQEVEPGLLALVAEVSGRLQVAEDGTLLFVFPPALRMRLLALSGRRRLQARLQATLRLAARLIRLSFGLVLLLVTTLVVVILSVLLIVRLFTSDDGDDAGLALLQGLAQVPLSILDLLAAGIRAPADRLRQSTLARAQRKTWPFSAERRSCRRSRRARSGSRRSFPSGSALPLSTSRSPAPFACSARCTR